MALIQKVKITRKKILSQIEKTIVRLKSSNSVEASKMVGQSPQAIETYPSDGPAPSPLAETGWSDISPTQLRLVPKPLYFLHIPKTAGSSLRYWLEDLFPLSDVVQLYTLADIEKNLPSQINNYWLYTGHLGFAFYELVAPDSDIETFTWLRDPIKREISQYQYIHHTKDYQIHMSPSPELMRYIDTVCRSSLLELCQSDAYLGYYDNLQTRMLAGLLLPQSYGRDDDGSGQLVESHPLTDELDDIKNTQEFAPYSTQELYQQKAIESLRNCERQYLDSDLFLEKAKENLANLSHFGLCEWMQPSIDLFCYRVGLPPQTFNVRLNQTQKTAETFSEDDLFAVQEGNRYDSELYRFARQEFCNRINGMWKDCLANNTLVEKSLSDTKSDSQLATIESMDIDAVLRDWNSPELRTAINQFLKINFQRHHQHDERQEQFNLCFFDATDSVFLAGWHPRAYCETTKAWQRWAGPETESSIFLPIKSGRDYQLTFTVTAYASQEILSSIQLLVGEKAILLERLEAVDSQGNSQYQFSGIIPSQLISASDTYTEFVFKTQATAHVKLPKNSPIDSYNASFALHNLLLRPMSQLQ